MIEILKDIIRNFWFPILMGLILFIIINFYYNEMDLIWYIFSIVICSAGAIASLIYGLIKHLKK